LGLRTPEDSRNDADDGSMTDERRERLEGEI